HGIEAGLRIHHDEVDRHHTGMGLFIERNTLVPDGQGERLLTWNRAQSVAFSAYTLYQLRYLGFLIQPGLRIEAIWGGFLDRKSGVSQSTEQVELMPGLGLNYELTPDWVLFAGIHRGFSPVAPGQPPGVRPERSWNYEAGTRFGRIEAQTNAEVAFFLSDYENITGECSGASGCPIELIDRMFNGDRALIMGIEAAGAHLFQSGEFRIPLRASYTFTWSRFATAFVSENPQFGKVEVGDHLPYIPEHQFTVVAGLKWRAFDTHLQLQHIGPMRDKASKGPIQPGEGTDPQTYFDANVGFQIDSIRLYVRGENLLMATPIASLRPFGARPGRPFLVMAGLEAQWN
ncbi:MAG: TonB-dependent receptor, partial [Deltaproteobacteria bacterium]|nr:TonB-dependent receptor [Deltaproteobacteria bacterium]